VDAVVNTILKARCYLEDRLTIGTIVGTMPTDSTVMQISQRGQACPALRFGLMNRRSHNMRFDIEILGKGFYAITHSSDAGKEWLRCV
jgi:hypothetical protein